MKKIGDVTSTADKNGEWTNGNVAAGIVPTILEAGWLNSVQREILGVIIAAGLQQDKNDDTQLFKAISKIISGGNYATEEDLKKYLAKDKNGADIQDTEAFIKNLGLREWLEKQIKIPVGMFSTFPHRATQLPPKWYSTNGDRFSVSSPQGQALKSLPAEMKSDWGITESGGMINVPNIKQPDGRTPFLRPVNGTSRQVGHVDGDKIRNIYGSVNFAMSAAGLQTATGQYLPATVDGAFRTSVIHSGSSSFSVMRDEKIDVQRCGATMDVSMLVPTGTENKPLDIGVTLAIYLGV